MAFPSMKFKRLLCSYDREERYRILTPLAEWLSSQTLHDPMAMNCGNALREALAVNSWASNKEFKEHYFWTMMCNHDSCKSFQLIVKSRLAVPTLPPPSVIPTHKPARPRKAIPKKIRGDVWTNAFGDSTSGKCYCCQTPLNCFADWHAGHIISHAHGGPDTADNLRPVCGSCNLSMGSDNMDDYKTRYYPAT